MANNELSGPVVATFLAKYLATQPRKHTYRLVFVPETIGAITYLSRNLPLLKERIVAGFNISCVGDERAYSYVESRYADTLADKVAECVLSSRETKSIRYSFLDRGSDERQYCSPGVDLPLVTLCRSKFGTYPEYHSSLDDPQLVTPAGLRGGLQFVKDCVDLLEQNTVYKVTCLGEPQLGKRGLYPHLSHRGSIDSLRALMDFIAYADGTNDLIDISKTIRRPVKELIPIASKLLAAGLITAID
jgi:aminopeptidase-like protein